MARPASETVKYSLILLSILFIYNCANQLPPGGGDIDITPPEVIEVYPADGTLNFSDDYFELNFSEYVDKRSVKDAIFISPAVEGNIDLDWSGKSVTVTFPQKLKENTTYNITIGTDVADFNNRNKMAAPFNFSFSTGTKLDKRVITGKVIAEKSQGVFLMAYLNPADTLNPSRTKPSYISQSGIDGSYKIQGLSAGRYRVFAVQDEFRDLLFQADQDKIGMPFKEVDLAENDSLYAGLNFILTTIDTVRPRLMTSVMTDKNHVVLTFSEELAQTCISSKNFNLYDSTAAQGFVPLYVHKTVNKPTEVVLSVNNNLTEKSQLYLTTDTLKDLSGNIYTYEHNFVAISLKPDTIKPMLTRFNPPTGNQTADFENQVFNFAFNDGIDTAAVKKNISFTDTMKKKINYNIIFADNESFSLTSSEKQEASKDYIITFNLRGVTDAAGNHSDTTIQYKFRTITGLDFTGLNGSVENIDFKKNPLLILQGIDEKKITYKQPVTINKFVFERIEPGTYRLWTFYDSDSNNVYTNGYPYPFKPSEEFYYYPDSISLRARWAISDLIFDVKK